MSFFEMLYVTILFISIYVIWRQTTWLKSEQKDFDSAYRENENQHNQSEWAGSDSNQRPPPCQGGILTRLDHRPASK